MALDTFQRLADNLIKEEIIERLKKGEEITDDRLNEMVQSIYSESSISEVSKPVFDTLLIETPEMVESNRLEKLEFESRLQKRWMGALYKLGAVIQISMENGMSIIDKYVEENNSSNSDSVFDVLMKLQAKAVVISQEIQTLLKSGFVDGAMSRWRSLHECNVFFTVLSNKYDDKLFTKKLIKRYLDYSIVEAYQEINKYKKMDDQFVVDDLNINEIKNDYKKVLKKYGNEYKRPNEWARPFFTNKRRIYFSDLEKLAGVDTLTMYYKQANYQIHASPTGIYNSLAMINNPKIERVGYVFGPSNYGLSIPGQLTVISLSQITIKLLLLEPNMDRLVIAKVLNKFVEKATVKFDEIQNEIEQEELGEH